MSPRADCRDFDPRLRQYARDEGPLGDRRVSRAPALLLLGHLQLQRLVLGDERWIGAQRVAKGEPLDPEVAAGLG